ncbi:ARM repeat-containing protein [Schizophyllum commune Tattone D]|nr:ARM repeat-containing protein [Schizophyllum commune Tattone D]
MSIATHRSDDHDTHDASAQMHQPQPQQQQQHQPEPAPAPAPPMASPPLPPASAPPRVAPPSFIALPPPVAFALGIRDDTLMGTPPSPCLQFFTAPNSPMADSPAQSPAQAMDSPPPRTFMPQSPTPVPAPAPIVSPSAEAPPEEPFAVPPEPGMELSLDDDNLSVLEKIYLFSRSKATFHRVFIAHALPSFLEQISPQEAVEYVLPLLSGLAMDDEDTVKEAFAAELLAIMWYFFTKCQVVPDDPQTEDLMFPSARSAPAIPVQAFTPILGTLLLSSNGQVGLSTRYAIVTILNRIQRLNESESRKADFVPPASRPSSSRGILAKDPRPNPKSSLAAKAMHSVMNPPEEDEESDDDEDLPPTGLFGYEEREMFEQELLQQVVIGMGRLDQQWSNIEEGYVDIDPLAMQEDRSPNVGMQLGDQYPPEYPARSPLDEPRVRSPAEPLPEDDNGDRMPAPKPATDYFPRMPSTMPAPSPPTSSPDYTPPWVAISPGSSSSTSTSSSSTSSLHTPPNNLLRSTWEGPRSPRAAAFEMYARPESQGSSDGEETVQVQASPRSNASSGSPMQLSTPSPPPSPPETAPSRVSSRDQPPDKHPQTVDPKPPDATTSPPQATSPPFVSLNSPPPQVSVQAASPVSPRPTTEPSPFVLSPRSPSDFPEPRTLSPVNPPAPQIGSQPTSNVPLPMPTVSAPNEQSPFGGLRQNVPQTSSDERADAQRQQAQVSPPVSMSREHAMSPGREENLAAVDDDAMNNMTLDENPEEEQAAFGRVSSMSLISAVSVSVKLSESAQQAFVTEVERVCRDPIYWVRREAAFAVGALAKVVPDEIVMTSLLPLFEGLRSDSMWHVRHSALFAFPALLARLDAQQRRRVALETVIPLSRDESAAVRTGTLEALGEAIYSFRNDDGDIPQELLELFVGRREDRRIRDHSAPDEEWVIPSDWGVDFERQDRVAPPDETPLDSFYRDPGRPLICAFNLPAVALTLGRERWGAIRELYLHLADDCTTKVRRTLAASLGALAGIIGPENARQDLMVVWWDSIRCEEQEVRGKVIEAMEPFVDALGPCTERIEVVQSVLQVWDEGMLTAWRERETVAKSLIGVTRAIGQEDPKLVRSLLMKTLEDNVAAVRETAVHSLQEIWSIFGGRRDVLEDVRKDILTLARSSSYRQRMTFVACQQTIILPTESGHPCMVADDHVWQTLLPLAQDSIVGVRIGVSRLVANYWDKYLQHTHIPDGPMLDVIRKLTSDPAHEVQTYLPARLRGVAGPLLEPKPMERSSSSTARRRAREAANMSATFSKPPRAASILIPE